MKRVVSVLAVLSVFIPSIIFAGQHSHTKKSGSAQDVSREAKSAVEVYNGPTAPKPFVIIGELNAKGSTEKMLINKMKTSAFKSGADAILMYRIEAGTFPSMWTGAVLSHAKGIAVRWAKDGETGLTKIPDGVSVPVIH